MKAFRRLHDPSSGQSVDAESVALSWHRLPDGRNSESPQSGHKLRSLFTQELMIVSVLRDEEHRSREEERVNQVAGRCVNRLTLDCCPTTCVQPFQIVWFGTSGMKFKMLVPNKS